MPARNGSKTVVYFHPFLLQNAYAKHIEDELFRLCTINPARHMKIDAGTLSVGSSADVAIFRREKFSVTFGDRADGSGQLRRGEYIYRPLMTVKNGEAVYRDIAF